MPQITNNAKYLYGLHGWTDKDIAYIREKADEVHESGNWVMAVAVAPDGVVWLYPTSKDNKFPISLWKKIKWYIEEYSEVVIPMNKNIDKVTAAASRYNGYLLDNLWLFGDKLHGLKEFKGGKLWHR